jgi:hypothetical protein
LCAIVCLTSIHTGTPHVLQKSGSTVSGQYLEDFTIAKRWSDDRPMSGVKPYALDPIKADACGQFPKNLSRKPG